MKDILIILTCNATSIIFAIGADILSYHGIKGWGWFIFAAIISASIPTFKNKKEEQKKNEDNTNLILG